MGIRTHIRGGLMMLPPYTWEEVDPITGEKSYKGVTIGPFLNITKSLNITLELDVVKEGLWGARLPNGTYVGMQRRVYDGDIDIAIGPFFQSTVTVMEMEPGFPHMFTKFCFLSGYRQLYSTDLATAPFDLQVSVCILLMCLLIPCLFYFMQRGNPIQLSLFESFYLTSSVFLQDPIDNRRFLSAPSRMTLASWSFGSFIIVQIVTGILRSNTAVKTPIQLLESFQDIADNPKLAPMGWAGTPTLIILEERRPETFRVINERVRQMGTLVPLERIYSDKYINRMLDGEAVFIQEPASMVRRIAPLCDKYKGFFHISEKDNVQIEMVWYYSPKLDKETRTAYSTRMMWLFESAVPWLRQREYVSAPPKCFTFAIRSNLLGGDNESFSMEHLLPFFYALFLGYMMSLAAFIYEQIKYSCFDCRKSNWAMKQLGKWRLHRF